MANFGNLDQGPNDDPNNAGVSNEFEEKLGSNPNDSSSGLPNINLGGLTYEGFSISFQTVIGLNYKIKVKNNLSNQSWEDATSIINGDGNIKTIIDTQAIGKNKRFYNLEISKPLPY